MRHYELHHRRTTFREFIRLGYPNTLNAILTWLPLKIGLIRWQAQTMTRPDSIRDGSIPVDDLPEPARNHMLTAIPDLVTRGFVDSLIDYATSIGADGERIIGTCMRSRHTSCDFILQMVFSFNENGLQQSQDQLVTFLHQDRSTSTVRGRPTLNGIPGAQTTYHPSADLDQLLVLHHRKLAVLDTAPIPIRDADDMIRLVDASMRRYFDHMVGRGLFTEVEPCDNGA